MKNKEKIGLIFAELLVELCFLNHVGSILGCIIVRPVRIMTDNPIK